MRIGNTEIGAGHPCYIISEIGINHNSSLDIARDLIKAAAAAGCNAVKLQKRSPEHCVDPAQWDVERDTPFGRMKTIDYRRRMEFTEQQYELLALAADEAGVHWFASCWDVPSVEFVERFDPVAHKVASASITDDDLLDAIRDTGRPVIMSTGMSTQRQIQRAITRLGPRIFELSGPAGPTERFSDLALLHATSTYPCPDHEINLRAMFQLRDDYPGIPIGYSGHELGIHITEAAVAMGACIVERHITLDRTMKGSDHAASLEPAGLAKLVRNIRSIERAMGDGVKRVYQSEMGPMGKLRRVRGDAAENG
jgi:N-acetylneuraminate synthase